MNTHNNNDTDEDNNKKQSYSFFVAKGGQLSVALYWPATPAWMRMDVEPMLLQNAQVSVVHPLPNGHVYV